MIKINLLPKSIYEKQIIRNVAIGFAVLLIAIIVGGVTYGLQLDKNIAKVSQDAASAEAWKAQVEKIQADATAVEAAIQPIKQKVVFINGVLDYNKKFPALYEDIAKWTYKKASYSSISCDGTTVTMAGTVRNLDDLGRFVLNLYKATDLFSMVNLAGVPGYGVEAGSGGGTGMPGYMGAMPMPTPVPMPMPGMVGLGAISTGVERAISSDPGRKSIPFSVVCTLKTPITAPVPPGAAAPAAGQPGAPAAPAPMPGMAPTP